MKRSNPFIEDKCHKGNPLMKKCECHQCKKDNPNPFMKKK